MFRCHFTRHDRIVAGENLSAPTLEQAITEAQALLAEQQGGDRAHGFEIWQGTSLLYTSPFISSSDGPDDSPRIVV